MFAADNYSIDPTIWDGVEVPDFRSYNQLFVFIGICPVCHKPGLAIDKRKRHQKVKCWNCHMINEVLKTARKMKIRPLIRGVRTTEERLVKGK